MNVINVNVEVGAPNKEAKVSHPNPMSINTNGRLAITPNLPDQMTYIPSYLLLGYAAHCLYDAMSPKKQFKSAVIRMSHLEFVTMVLYLGVYRHFKVVVENKTIEDLSVVKHALEMLESLNIGDWLIPDSLLPWFEAIGKVEIPGNQFALLPTLPSFTPEKHRNFGVANADSASFLPNFFLLIHAINMSLFDKKNVSFDQYFTDSSAYAAFMEDPPTGGTIDTQSDSPPRALPGLTHKLDKPTPMTQYFRFPGLTHKPDKPTAERKRRVGFDLIKPHKVTTNWEDWLCLAPSRFQVWVQGWKAFTDGLSCKKSVSQLGSVGSKASLIRSIIFKDEPVAIDDNRFTPTVKSRDFVEGTDFTAGVTFGPNMRINGNCAYNNNDNHGRLGKTITDRYFDKEYFSDTFENLTQTMYQYLAVSET